MNQVEMVSLGELVKEGHSYRSFDSLWDFSEVERMLKKRKKNNPHEGYGLERLFRCLIIQYLEDLSDRELERYLEENTAAKWFCGFGLLEKTPRYNVFSQVRARIGTSLLAKIFQALKKQLISRGYMNEVFTFVDASQLISKAQLWAERDKAIEQKIEKLNNKTLPDIAHDKEAKIGCKGKNKFWYGYKKHVSVDMQSGFVNKVAITPANTPDQKGFKHVSPRNGATYTDKAYCDKETAKDALTKGTILRAIKKNNMKTKNKELDKWITKIRSPYERIFSKTRKRVRYIGVVKNQFSAFMEAIAFNFKRSAVLAQQAYS